MREDVSHDVAILVTSNNRQELTYLQETTLWTPDSHVGIIHVTKHDVRAVLFRLNRGIVTLLDIVDDADEQYSVRPI